MRSFSVQVLVILTTFGGLCSVIAKSVSQRTSSKDEASCDFEGNTHPADTTFVTADCSAQCYCTVDGDLSCLPICPTPAPTQCPPGRVLREEEYPAVSGGGRCTCKRRFCALEKVLCFRKENGEKYKVGETFSLNNCSKTCRCNGNGQISCAPTCSKNTCPKGTRPKRNGEIQLENNCSCAIQECVAVPKSFCYVDGRRFRRGRVFITKDCKLKCRCKKNGKTRCTRLCKKKQNKQECGPDETLENINESSAGGRCSCETKICISTLANVWGNKVSHLESRNTRDA